MLCHFLGKFDISSYVLNKTYHDKFKELKDFRLVYALLEASALKDICRAKKTKLPNSYYGNIANLRLRENNKVTLTEENNFYKGAVYASKITSMFFSKDLFYNEPAIHAVSLCENIYMPALSLTKGLDGILSTHRNLKDKDQLSSFLKLAAFYRDGTNGCPKNISQSLNYYKLAAEAGDISALKEIMKLIAQGYVDILREDSRVWYCYLNKLKNSKHPEEIRSLAFICEGMLDLSRNDYRKSEVNFRAALRLYNNHEHYVNFLFSYSIDIKNKL